MREKGIVKWFDPKKGHGSIKRKNAPDAYVHGSGIQEGYEHLEAGETVEFDLIQGPNVPQAVNVVPVKRAPIQLKNNTGPKKSFVPPPQPRLSNEPLLITRTITITESISVKDLAKKLGISAKRLIARLLEKGLRATVNQTLDIELAKETANYFGAEVKVISIEDEAEEFAKALGAYATPRASRVDSDFTIIFDPELTEDEIRGAFEALAEYYRSCGGVGLAADFEPQCAEVLEPVHA